VCQAQVAAATPAAAAHDQGDTSLGLAAAFDDGATMMPVAAGRPVDPDATNLGLAAAFDSNATILPAAGPRADDETSLGAEPQAYGKIIEGLVLLEQKDARQAIKVLTEANTLLDTWIGRFDLGRAYLAAGAYPQADSEFDRCLKRSGEALSLFLDEEPTSGFLPPVHYCQGQVREGLKSAGFAEPYRDYLAIRGAAGGDPMLADIRRRIPTA